MARWGSLLIVVGIAASCGACAASREVFVDRSPSSCAAFEAGAEVDAARLALRSPRADEIAMLGQRVADASAIASTLRGAVALECRRLALELGANEKAVHWIDAEESSTERAKGTCTLAAEMLKKKKRAVATEPTTPCAADDRVLPTLLARCRAVDDACTSHARRAAELREACPLQTSRGNQAKAASAARDGIEAPILVVAARLRGRRWVERIVATSAAADAELARSEELSLDERMCLRTFSESARTAREDALAAVDAATIALE